MLLLWFEVGVVFNIVEDYLDWYVMMVEYIVVKVWVLIGGVVVVGLDDS